MTKAEEKKLWNRIKKLVESAGEDSYIAQAFEGLEEIVLDNIENDYANSVQSMADAARKYGDKASTLRRENEKLQLALNAAQLKEKIASDERDELRAEVKRLGDVLTERQAELDEWAYERNDAIRALKQLEEDKNQEIIELKAKMYDLMTTSK